jgi:transposase
MLEKPEDTIAMKAELLGTAADLAAALAELAALKEFSAYQALEIAKLKHQLYGRSAERSSAIINQLELELGSAIATATTADLTAEEANAAAGLARSANPDPSPDPRKKPVRGPLPEHLPRERVVVTSPCACVACGSDRLTKVGEDITETLEVIPRSWKVIQHVRERFSCRSCEAFSQAPAPFHAIARGRAGPSLLAMVLYEKYGQHVPLNRQAERYAREGVPLALSTLADHVGACAFALKPMADLIEAHVLAAGRIHADDTTVPILAEGKTITGRLWTYVRDDKPFAGDGATLEVGAGEVGTGPPAVFFKFSQDRSGDHPKEHLGSKGNAILQADAFAGYNHLYEQGRLPGPLIEVACWAHARRKFFELVVLPKTGKAGPSVKAAAPLAHEAITRIDAIFAIERAINGASAQARLATRTAQSADLVADLFDWMDQHRATLSRHAPVAKAMEYMLKRKAAFTVCLKDGRACMTNNAAERALRPVALGRKAWLFAGSVPGGDRAALIYTLIQSAKLNNIDPQAYLACLLSLMPAWPNKRLGELAPWNWKPKIAAQA